MSEAFWNGERCEAHKCLVIVAKAKKPTYWYAGLAGTTRRAVRVVYGPHTFYLDDEDGSGWGKVTAGRGSSTVGHCSLDIEREVTL